MNEDFRLPGDDTPDTGHISRVRSAKFRIGAVVRHRKFPFRGVIFDVDPVFSNTEAWWESIPAEVRPRRDQPFYHLFAENDQSTYTAYVSEENLREDTTGQPIRHAEVKTHFNDFDPALNAFLPKPRNAH